jgi:hypothetical protein
MPDIIQQFLSPGIFGGTLESRPGSTVSTTDSVATFANFITPGLAIGEAGARIQNRRASGYVAPIQFDGMPIPEPQRVYDFRVRLPSIGATIPMAEGVDINVTEVTTQSPEPIGGRHRYIAGTYDAPTLLLILYHNQASEGVLGHVALDYINAWKKLVQNQDGTYNYPETYLFSIYADFRNVDQTDGYTIEYRKCFPLTVSPVQMRFNRSDRTAIQVTFSVERIITRTDGASSSSGLAFASSGQSTETAPIAPSSADETPADPSSFQSDVNTDSFQ